MTDKLVRIESPRATGEVEQEEYVDPNEPIVGHWYWYKDPNEGHHDIEGHALGCVTRIGTNYAEVVLVGGRPGNGDRVHLDQFADLCHPAPDAQEFIDRMVDARRSEAKVLMEKVHQVTAALGVGQLQRLGDGNETQALARITGNEIPAEEYKQALIKAKKETLPELFQEIKAANESMAMWMSANLIPLKAEAEGLKPLIKKIEGRIFNVELYAGLTEQVVQITEGGPAPDTEQIHLFQRRLYMDEECLANYRTGGMTFDDIEQFDEWMAEPENLDRILPFPRCMVAFRVRHHDVPYEHRSLRSFISLFSGEDPDKYTYLYMRNGDQVFRLSTGIEFDEKLFPDLDKQQLEGKLYAKMYSSTRVDEVITEDRYKAIMADRAEQMAKYEKEYAAYKAEVERRKKLPKEERKRLDKEDYLWPPSTPSDYWAFDQYKPYDDDNVHKDEISAYIQDKMDRHNRLVLVLQGLLDRSPVFHPHPPWQLWTPEGFGLALKLIFDRDYALVAGKKPDFKAYAAKLRASIKKGSITIGQQAIWEAHERKKDRERNGYKVRGEYPGYLPYGNPGPGVVAEVKRFSKAGATFEWERERQSYPYGKIATKIRVPTEELFNVSAYKPGDFKQFFNDPRTREEYLRWAPLMLEAEEYHAKQAAAPESLKPLCLHKDAGKRKEGDGPWICDCGHVFSEEESAAIDADYESKFPGFRKHFTKPEPEEDDEDDGYEEFHDEDDEEE